LQGQCAGRTLTKRFTSQIGIVKKGLIHGLVQFVRSPVLNPNYDRSAPVILVAEPESSVRAKLREILKGEGFTSLVEAQNEEETRAACRDGHPDLAFIDINLCSDTRNLVREIRWGILGSNNFINIFLLTWNAKAANIALMSSAGVDEIVTKPIDAGDLLARMAAQAQRHRPYVASGDYLGPERRSAQRAGPVAGAFGARPGRAGLRKVDIHPPNLFQARLERRSQLVAKAPRLVADTCIALMQQRLLGELDYIEGAVHRLEDALTDGLSGAEVEVEIAKVQARTGPLLAGLSGPALPLVKAQFTAIADLTGKLLASNGSVERRLDATSLVSLSSAIMALQRALSANLTLERLVTAQSLAAAYRPLVTHWQ
jgi:DNA-binding response OmpR family regulator